MVPSGVTQDAAHAAQQRNSQRFFGSPKNQRRMRIGGIAAFLIGIAVFVSLVLLRGTADKFTSPISTTRAQQVKQDKVAPVSPQALVIARRFMETAVLRKHVDAAYDLVDVDLRGRMMRKQWDTGNIPVVGY